MNKLQGKEKVIWYVVAISSILLLLLGVYLKVNERRKYEGSTTATCLLRTRCTYTVEGADYIYQADYYTDVHPNKPLKREIRYNLNDPSDTHLTGMGISESCIFLAISLIILAFMYFIMREKVLFLGAGFLALFLSFLLYSPLLGSMNPFLYFKAFKYYGASALIPLLFFLGGILFVFLSFKRFVWKEKEKTVAYKQECELVKETKGEVKIRKEKEARFNKNFATIFNFIIASIHFIEAGVVGYAFCYLMWSLFNKEKDIAGTPVGISLTGIFIVPLFFIFIIKVLDIVVLYFIKNDAQERLELFDKVKKVFKFLMTIEILCSILFLLIPFIIHENFLSILFVSIAFILPISLMLISTITHFILDHGRIANKEILEIRFDRIVNKIRVILFSLFLLFGIITATIGMVLAMKEGNYAILIFYFFWVIVLGIILYFVLKQFKQR